MRWKKKRKKGTLTHATLTPVQNQVLFPTTQVSRNVEQQHLGHPTTVASLHVSENLWSRRAASRFSCTKKYKTNQKKHRSLSFVADEQLNERGVNTNVLKLVGHSVCTLAAVLVVSETMALVFFV